MSRKKSTELDGPAIYAPGYISQAEAAARIKVAKSEMTRIKQSGDVAGFYPEGVKWDEFLASYIEMRERKATERVTNKSVSQAEEFGKLALARTRMRQDQIKAGVTVYIYDILDGMEDVASGMRQAQAKLSVSMAKPMVELFTKMLMRVASTEDSHVISRALGGIDYGEVEREIKRLHDKNLGDLGERFREIMPAAIAKAKVAKG